MYVKPEAKKPLAEFIKHLNRIKRPSSPRGHWNAIPAKSRKILIQEFNEGCRMLVLG